MRFIRGASALINHENEHRTVLLMWTMFNVARQIDNFDVTISPANSSFMVKHKVCL